MTQHQMMNLCTSLKSVNDSGVLTVPLQSKGGISAMELTCRATTGAGGSASYGLLASITKIEISNVHGQSVLNLSATELYNIMTLKYREKPQLSEGTGAGAVQVVKLPIDFGIRGLDTFGLDMSKYPDCLLKIYYTLHINAGDGFSTLSFEADVDARISENQQPPYYQGLIRLAEAWHGTTSIQNPHRINLKNTAKAVGAYLYGFLSGTADNALVKNVALVIPSTGQKMLSASFSDFQERRRPLSGSIIASWLCLWAAPGLFGEATLSPLGAPELSVELEELVADGAVKLFLEEVLAS